MMLEHTHFKGALIVAAILTIGHAAQAQSMQTQTQMFDGHDASVGYFGDWAYGLWKGDCGYNTPVVKGMSFEPTNDNNTGAVLCGSESYAFNEFGWYTLWFNNGDNRRDTRWGDWAYGQWKAECGATDMVIGIAQEASHDSNRDVIMCLPTTRMTPPTYCYPAYSHSRVTTVVGFNPTTGQQYLAQEWTSQRFSTTGGNWGGGWPMLQCSDNEYVKGVSRGADGQSPVILCCGGNLSY
jgi:hypothetical protein